MFFKFLHSFTLQFSMLLPFLQVFSIFQAHSPHSYCNTHHKSQSHYGTTLNANKFNDHFLLFFCLRQPIVLGLIVHFFKHLVPFMMALLLYICMEAITIHQWLKCTLIFSIHPNAIITIFPVEGIHIHSSKSKHNNVITHSTAAQNWESTQSLSNLADRVSKLIYPAAATTQLWLRSYQPGYAVV